MTQYRKKPVVIEAFQMTEARRNDNSEWPNWLNEAWNKDGGEGALFIDADDPARQRLCIGTLEGVHRVLWDDFIIQGVKGEIYPCKPDIFAATYEDVAAPHGEAAPAQGEREVLASVIQHSRVDLLVQGWAGLADVILAAGFHLAAPAPPSRAEVEAELANYTRALEAAFDCGWFDETRNQKFEIARATLLALYAAPVVAPPATGSGR